ncbi:hypothetical protein J4526_05900 [Desulfurococcaceae archaeon MEX13E-LK6-19]|nr:hypothetical protein J4526_05900 [Desulfurococcaceae archaeon MEX13E-LK6-19]
MVVPVPVKVLEYSIMLFVAGILAGFILYKSSKKALIVSSMLGAIASIFLLVFCILVAANNTVIEAIVFNIPIYIDFLSILLLIVLSLLGFATLVYTPQYMEHYRRLSINWLYGAIHNTFILSMVLVVISRNLLYFIFFWEVMTLASYLLITWEYDNDSVRETGRKYFITMHILSTLPLLLAVITVYDTYRTLDIVVLRSIAGVNPVLYFLFLLGFGSKAGVVPFHFWLPDAHPAAPSNASALLSGAMIKVAVYGLIRTTCFMMPYNTLYGYIIATMGTITLTVGTLYALKQTDGKRLLAYHSVGQMGYIWLGVGVGIIFLSLGDPYRVFGVIALAAGLFHLLNHALFKGALFLAAGSILYRVHTRDLNRLGGLAKNMPFTALATIIAALAIAGVPPLNGFISKWMIYQATFLSNNAYIIFCGIMALFISAATLASFIKFYTTAFGGELNEVTKEAREVPLTMNFAQNFLSILCVVLGVTPSIVLPVLLGIGASSIGLDLASLVDYVSYSYLVIQFIPPWSSPLYPSFFSPITLAITILVLTTITVVYVASLRVPGTTGSWLCGVEAPVAQTKLKAKYYYGDFEESIEPLYAFGEELHNGLSKAKNTLFGGYEESLRVLLAEADKLKRAPRICVGYRRILCALHKFSERISGTIYFIPRIYHRLVKGDIYIDEMLWMPLVDFIRKSLVIFRGRKYNLVFYCILSAFMIFLLALIALLVIIKWGG